MHEKMVEELIENGRIRDDGKSGVNMCVRSTLLHGKNDDDFCRYEPGWSLADRLIAGHLRSGERDIFCRITDKCTDKGTEPDRPPEECGKTSSAGHAAVVVFGRCQNI